MTRGILIVGAESSLSLALAAEAGKRVEQYATALIPNRLTAPGQPVFAEQSEKHSRIILAWNPGSPLSARTMLIAAQTRLERIDEIFLVCTPPVIRGQMEDIKPLHIEVVICDYIKSWFFVVKELCSILKSQGSGTVVPVLSEPASETSRGETTDLVGPTVAASFRSIVQGLLSASSGKPYQVLAFSSESGEDAAFAAHIFKIIEEGNRRNTGKWHKYGKLGLFR
ncbi:MAG: hypothetical protein LBG76_07255 [Treponema sp.]|jgi:hypothetical protein|nr:hypothetical protein [Treponema sp.]